MISAEEGCSWDVINKSDIWEGVTSDGENESDKDDYVLVKQEDIMEGIASFMAAYLLSLKETKVGQCFCCFSFNCPILETWCLCTPVIGVHQIVTFCFLLFLKAKSYLGSMGLCDLKAVNGIYYFLVYFKGLIVRH